MITSRRFYTIEAAPLTEDARCYNFNNPYRSAYPSQLSEIGINRLTGETTVYSMFDVLVFYNKARGVVSYTPRARYYGTPTYKWDKHIHVRSMDDDSVLSLIRSTLLTTRKKCRCWDEN